MFTATLVLAILALVFFFLNLKSGKHLEGLIQGAKQFLAVLPVLVAAFILAGMLEALIPEAFVRQWLASEAGVRGVILGTIGGMILAMGPYASFPIISSIQGAGAGLGTTVALVTGWMLLGLSRFPFEMGVLGLRFTLTRMAISIPLCLLVGILAHLIEVFLL
ncbi:MAG: permease [Bacillota bacterium]|nr:permease [Bacillota bacterium]